MKRQHLRPLTYISDLGEVNHNRRWRSFRLRSGWTGPERDKYIPRKHRCPECGGDLVLDEDNGNYVRCQDCDGRFDADWSTYVPSVCDDMEAYKATIARAQ